MRTSSTDGTASQMRRASSTSSSVGAPKLVPAIDLGVQAADDVGVAPAEDHRPPRRDEVDELVAVGVPDVGALGARDEERVRHADALHGAHRRVDPAGDVALRLVEQAREVSVFTRVLLENQKARRQCGSTYYAALSVHVPSGTIYPQMPEQSARQPRRWRKRRARQETAAAPAKACTAPGSRASQEHRPMAVSIRHARPGDEPAVVELVQELVRRRRLPQPHRRALRAPLSRLRR